MRRIHDHRRPKYKPVCHKWVLEQVEFRLGDSPVNPCAVKNYILEVESVICNYINRDYVPAPLGYVFVNMVMDLLKSLAMNGLIDNEKLADLGVGSLTQIEDGDTNLKFSTSQTFSGSHVGDVDGLLYNYKIQLDKYRILRW